MKHVKQAELNGITHLSQIKGLCRSELEASHFQVSKVEL